MVDRQVLKQPLGDASQLDVVVKGGHLAAGRGTIGIAGAVQILVAITATQGFHPAHPEVIGIGAQDMNGLTKSQFDPEAVAVEQEYFERIEGEVCGKQEKGAAMGMAYDHEADDARGTIFLLSTDLTLDPLEILL